MRLGHAWEEQALLRNGFVMSVEENLSEAAPGRVMEGDLKPGL